MRTIKKILLISVFVVYSTISLSQQVNINGKAFGFKTGELILLVENEKPYITTIDNNKFEIEIPLKTSPQAISLYAPKLKRVIKFYAENGTMRIETYKKKFLKKTKVTGSKSQKLKNEIDSVIDAKDMIKFKELISDNINSLPAIDYLNMYKQNFSIKELQKLYSKIEDSNKDKVVDIKGYLDTYMIEEMKKGAKVYNFRWQEKTKIYELSDFQSKYVLLNFTSTACGSCWKTYEPMNVLQEEYEETIKIISFHIDDTKNPWVKIAKKNNLDFKCTSIWDVDKKENILAVYKIKILPTFILINPAGIILDRWSGTLRMNHIKSFLNKK